MGFNSAFKGLNKQQKNNVCSVVNGEVCNASSFDMIFILNLIHSENFLSVNIETSHDCV